MSDLETLQAQLEEQAKEIEKLNALLDVLLAANSADGSAV